MIYTWLVNKAAIVITGITLVLALYVHGLAPTRPLKTEVTLGNTVIQAELATTPAQITKGLMYRKTLGEKEGMLFVHNLEARHTYWMANTYIPLDIIWIDKNKEIVYISANTPPCTKTGSLLSQCPGYSPTKEAKYVLEVNAGWAEKNAVNVGDQVKIEGV